MIGYSGLAVCQNRFENLRSTSLRQLFWCLLCTSTAMMRYLTLTFEFVGNRASDGERPNADLGRYEWRGNDAGQERCQNLRLLEILPQMEHLL